MKEMWDERFSVEDYVYGTEPNEFYKEQIKKISPNGKALFLGEGEGRNAVYAAELGWEVDAVDLSDAGKVKAIKLADSKNVKTNYIVSDLAKFEITENSYDLIVLIFLHLPQGLRVKVHSSAVKALRNDGRLILEAYDKDQLKFGTGGPKVPELLYSLSEAAEDFIDLEFLLFEHKEIEMTEGMLHNGKSCVVRFVGRKENTLRKD